MKYEKAQGVCMRSNLILFVLVLVLVSQNFILKIFSIVTQDTNLSERRHFPTMDGKTIFKLAVQKLPEVVNEALEKAELAFVIFGRAEWYL